MPSCDCIVNKYFGNREVAQVFTPFGVVAVADDGKVFPTLAEALAHVKPKPPPEPLHAPEAPPVSLTE